MRIWLIACAMLMLSACGAQPITPTIAPTPAKPEYKISIASDEQGTRYDKTELEAPSGTSIALTFTNNTSRGERIMQNWVLVVAGEEDSVLKDAEGLALTDSFVRKGDPRVIAYSISIVGSQSTLLTFDAPPIGKYTYICTSPQCKTMRGTLTIK